MLMFDDGMRCSRADASGFWLRVLLCRSCEALSLEHGDSSWILDSQVYLGPLVLRHGPHSTLRQMTHFKCALTGNCTTAPQSGNVLVEIDFAFVAGLLTIPASAAADTLTFKVQCRFKAPGCWCFLLQLSLLLSRSNSRSLS